MQIEAPTWMARFLTAGLRVNINASKLYSTFIGFDLPDWPKFGHEGDAMLYIKHSDESLTAREWWLLDNKDRHFQVDTLEQLETAFNIALADAPILERHSMQRRGWNSLFQPTDM